MNTDVKFRSDELSNLPVSILNALPHPVFLINGEGLFVFANAAAEAFFQTSSAVLQKRRLDWYLASGSPMRTLVEQVQANHSPVNEYRVDISSPRIGIEKVVDVYAAPVPELPGSVVIMLQERSMADKIDRQLTHRGAARGVPGWRRCWRTRSRTRCRASAARRSCWRRRCPTRTAR